MTTSTSNSNPPSSLRERRLHDPPAHEPVAGLVVRDRLADGPREGPAAEDVREPADRWHRPEVPPADHEVRSRLNGPGREERGDLGRVVLAIGIEGEDRLRAIGDRPAESSRRAAPCPGWAAARARSRQPGEPVPQCRRWSHRPRREPEGRRRPYARPRRSAALRCSPGMSATIVTRGRPTPPRPAPLRHARRPNARPRPRIAALTAARRSGGTAARSPPDVCGSWARTMSSAGTSSPRRSAGRTKRRLWAAPPVSTPARATARAPGRAGSAGGLEHEPRPGRARHLEAVPRAARTRSRRSRPRFRSRRGLPRPSD